MGTAAMMLVAGLILIFIVASGKARRVADALRS